MNINHLKKVLKDNGTIIMVAETNFQGKKVFRKHLNLNSSISKQISRFKSNIEDHNDYAAIRIEYYCYPSSKQN